MKRSAPIYIPTKGRHMYMITSRFLTSINVSHNLVVEPHEVDAYENAIRRDRLLAKVVPLDLSYKDRYETCDDLGLSRSTGPGPARNFAWEHSMAEGHDMHWVMDDNLHYLARLNRNLKVLVADDAILVAMETFARRYANLAMCGPQYEAFLPRRVVVPPFVANTRIYSCNLIRNDIPFRWRGRYNEDTILSLDILKGGWATVQFNAFCQKKGKTQTLQGGNTTDFYLAEGKKVEGQIYAPTGTVNKSEMLVKVHPDVSRLAYRFSRVHHYVNYNKFKNIPLILKRDAVIEQGVNNFGMGLVYRGPQKQTDGRK